MVNRRRADRSDSQRVEPIRNAQFRRATDQEPQIEILVPRERQTREITFVTAAFAAQAIGQLTETQTQTKKAALIDGLRVYRTTSGTPQSAHTSWTGINKICA